MRLLPLLLVSAALFAQGPPDFTPPTPLFRAIAQGDAAQVRQLLANGANPNEARHILGFSAAMMAAGQHDVAIFRALVERGADLTVTDATGSTILMWAAANEAARTEIVAELLKRGVNPNAQNKMGETALDWAQRRGQTPVVALLRKAGASDAGRVRPAVERAIAVLQKSGPQFVKVSGCVSCHHQSLPQMANALARERGLMVNEEIASQQVKATLANIKPMRGRALEGTDSFPDIPISVPYLMLGLAAEGYAPDENTAAMAHLVASKQMADGHWQALLLRPPMESSHITGTVLSVRALQLYGTKDALATLPEAQRKLTVPLQDRVMRAREWLLRAKAETSEERAMRLLGLFWAQARPDEVGKAARAVLAEQQPDGGWAQLPGLATDAYATGQALTALRLSGAVAATDPAYQRGAAWLLRAQLADGSWLVRSRSIPVQQLKESGFPHGRDQWSSASGTSWAAMALSLGLEPAPRKISATPEAVTTAALQTGR